MTSLILKRASASRISGQGKDEEYDVIADGKVVGRILQENTRPRSELSSHGGSHREALAARFHGGPIVR